MGDFGEDSDDSDGEGGLGNVSRVIIRPPGHSGKAKRGHLCFDASFETGNLGRVDLVNEFEYDLFIRPDTCNPRFRFWFNFTVDNCKQDQRVVFNIVNLSKGRNLFNENMTPLVKSTSRNKWQRIPKENVYYHKSHLHHGHYILSFSFGFDREDEIFQFALAPPYSYSKLQTFLNLLESKASHLKECFKREQLGTSLQKRKLDIISIGSFIKKKHKSKRRIVAIMARVHPGESPSSFVCQGLLELLISSNCIATTLREHVVFKIIPMMNPDGVFVGNYRSTIMGIDLNRTWHVANSWCHPTAKAVLDILQLLDKSKEFQLDFVIDIHAHSSLKGCFIYGNTYEDVYRYERHILFPKLLAGTTIDYQQENTMFNADPSKIGTSRRFLCSILSDKVNCYSFEVSIYGYKVAGSDVIIPYTENSYMRCGRNLIRTVLEYYHTTGAIAIQPVSELSPKTRKIRRRDRARPLTSCRQQATLRLHLQDIHISIPDDEESDSSESISHQKSPRRHYLKVYSPIGSPKPQTLIVVPEPSLSIIDFNIISRNIERSRRKLISGKVKC